MGDTLQLVVTHFYVSYMKHENIIPPTLNSNDITTSRLRNIKAHILCTFDIHHPHILLVGAPASASGDCTSTPTILTYHDAFSQPLMVTSSVLGYQQALLCYTSSSAPVLATSSMLSHVFSCVVCMTWHHSVHGELPAICWVSL